MEKYTLDDLKTFVAVVEAGGFNQAGMRLDTSTATVSRRVTALEGALGVKLLQRTTRRLSLTEAGEEYYQDLKDILIALSVSESKLSDQVEMPRGHLRLAASVSFGVVCLSPVLPRFLEAYPMITVDLRLDDDITDLFAEGFDMLLRIGYPGDSGSLVATKICDIEGVFCAAPDYLAEFGEPQKPEDLAAHNCLHYSLVSRRREWNIDESLPAPKGQFSCNSGEVLVQAALAGQGVLSTPRYLVEEALADGRLKVVLRNHPFVALPLYALRSSRQFTPTKVRTMIDFLRDNFASISSTTC